jgi:galactokinase
MEVYQAFASDLDPVLARRARHFFSENVRVLQSRRAWDMGDLPGFGALINASGQSSIDNYECGSPELIALYETLRNCPGVYGARFSGAGFRGSCIGLCEPGAEGAIRAAVDRAYPTAHPHVADRYEVHFCESADGASLL